MRWNRSEQSWAASHYGSNVSGYIERSNTIFFNLEKAVDVQRQTGYAVAVLQKFQIFDGNFLKELFQQTANM